MKYDYLIVGSGFFGATFAHFAKEAGKKCLVIDKRPLLEAMYIVKTLRESMSINTALTFSILPTKRYGPL